VNMQEAIASIQQSLDTTVEMCKDLPQELLRWKPAEDKWSVIEVLCHVEEAIPYWLDEVGKLVESPGAEWGRGLQDVRRLAAVAAAESRPLGEVLAAIRQAKEQVQSVLGPLTAEQLGQAAPSRNPRFGTKPLSFVIEHLLVEHAAKHAEQIARNIEQYKQAG